MDDVDGYVYEKDAELEDGDDDHSGHGSRVELVEEEGEHDEDDV